MKHIQHALNINSNKRLQTVLKHIKNGNIQNTLKRIEPYTTFIQTCRRTYRVYENI